MGTVHKGYFAKVKNVSGRSRAIQSLEETCRDLQSLVLEYSVTLLRAVCLVAEIFGEAGGMEA